MPTRAELLDLAAGEAARAQHIDWSAEGAGAIVAALDALRLTVAASLEPDLEFETLEPARWSRVELFGHTVVYGLAGETFFAGRRWLEVVEPRVVNDGSAGVERVVEERTKRYHPNAVYALSEVTQEEAEAGRREQEFRFF